VVATARAALCLDLLSDTLVGQSELRGPLRPPVLSLLHYRLEGPPLEKVSRASRTEPPSLLFRDQCREALVVGEDPSELWGSILHIGRTGDDDPANMAPTDRATRRAGSPRFGGGIKSPANRSAYAIVIGSLESSSGWP